jgi:hypothetical protein
LTTLKANQIRPLTVYEESGRRLKEPVRPRVFTGGVVGWGGGAVGGTGVLVGGITTTTGAFVAVAVGSGVAVGSEVVVGSGVSVGASVGAGVSVGSTSTIGAGSWVDSAVPVGSTATASTVGVAVFWVWAVSSPAPMTSCSRKMKAATRIKIKKAASPDNIIASLLFIDSLFSLLSKQCEIRFFTQTFL